MLDVNDLKEGTRIRWQGGKLRGVCEGRFSHIDPQTGKAVVEGLVSLKGSARSHYSKPKYKIPIERLIEVVSDG
jgi:hypothetical protein